MVPAGVVSSAVVARPALGPADARQQASCLGEVADCKGVVARNARYCPECPSWRGLARLLEV